MFFISMVARIFEPGCKSDYMVVLECEQGIQKSRACLALATAPYFSDCLSDIHHKDAKQHLRGKWLIEISELVAFSKAATETLKAFITRTTEKYRPPYGHEDVAEPRQCVFIGTTNREAYIKDETGGRRFWLVKTGAFDIAALERDRDQLFSEAVDRYRHGEHWWPDPALEKEHIKPEQDDRYEGDAWEHPIAEYLKGVSETYVLTIARDGLGFDIVAKVGSRDQHRIVAILFKLGWRRGKHTDRGTPYVRG
jgi:predicted P-loop ATPase